MRRMQGHEAHSLPDMTRDPFDDLVGNLPMGGVSPPEKHVGFGQSLFEQAVFRLLQCRRLGSDIGFGVQGRRDAPMHAVRIDGAHDIAGLLVDVLAPDNRSDRRRNPLSRLNRDREKMAGLSPPNSGHGAVTLTQPKWFGKRRVARQRQQFHNAVPSIRRPTGTA